MITRRSTHRPTFPCVTLACGVCLLGAVSALAADAFEQRSTKVNYSDLNLSTFAGARTLYQRISSAARTVCGEAGRRLEEQLDWNRCYRSAIADAVTRVNSPLLVAVQQGHISVTAMNKR
jgi:UrcA family protein